tara:strand:+ start:1066 stop:1458 length:393 start_codon:yes stop_codon:yes gene_type:complete
MDDDDYELENNFDDTENDEFIENDDEENNEIDDQKFNIITYDEIQNNIKNKEKKTVPYLTKFEKARIIGLRLQQLAYNAEPKVNTSNLDNIEEIVKEELKQKKIPFIVRRSLPNGNYEDWKIEEFLDIIE